MYWYKQVFNKTVNPLFHYGERGLTLLFFVGVFVSLLPSCKPDNLQNGATPKHFDIKGYFEAEAARLKKRNPLITKTVTHNGFTEVKKLNITNWNAELGLFIQSDINKPAWRDSYNTDSSATSIIYKAKTSDLKTQLVIITKNEGKIKWIMIYNTGNNKLYHTREKLSYFPDSLYMIEKVQKVRLLNENSYLIKGKLN
ncbi:hypothetical protein [Mucilaginibacter antarcticus]|uniref:Uncharacterized protein n=1 Tax=Mucilaginibacter antarcticus TaxID=1855725 RepID=A0ABW5XQ31_9SPHI